MSRMLSFPYGIITDALGTAWGGSLVLLLTHWLGLLLGMALTGEPPRFSFYSLAIVMIVPFLAIWTIWGWLLYPLLAATWATLLFGDNVWRKLAMLGVTFTLSAITAFAVMDVFKK